jgi:hypothetical protein
LGTESPIGGKAGYVQRSERASRNVFKHKDERVDEESKRGRDGRVKEKAVPNADWASLEAVADWRDNDIPLVDVDKIVG